MNYSPPGSSVHGISQARTLEWVAISFSRGFPPFPHGLPRGYTGKESACNARDQGSIPGSGRIPGEGNGNPLQCSCLETPMDRRAWWAQSMQWIRIHMPRQGTRVQSPLWEDSVCWRQLKPVNHNYGRPRDLGPAFANSTPQKGQMLLCLDHRRSKRGRERLVLIHMHPWRYMIYTISFWILKYLKVNISHFQVIAKCWCLRRQCNSGWL